MRKIPKFKTLTKRNFSYFVHIILSDSIDSIRSIAIDSFAFIHPLGNQSDERKKRVEYKRQIHSLVVIPRHITQ